MECSRDRAVEILEQKLQGFKEAMHRTEKELTASLFYCRS